MVTPLYGPILMRYPAREYEDVSPRSKPNALENSWNNQVDKVAVYTRDFKRYAFGWARAQNREANAR